MKFAITYLLAVLTTAALIVLVLNTPASWYHIALARLSFGTIALTNISGTDQLSAYPTVQNANNTVINTALNNLIGTTTSNQLTSLPNQDTTGTITTGIWNGTPITVPYGGTGSTTLSAFHLLIGSSTNAVDVVNGLGTSGQILTSQGDGLPPYWNSAAFDTTQNYSLTGNWLWNAAASSSLFAVLNTLYVGSTATSTIQGSTSGTSQLQGYLNVLGSGTATSTFSSNLVVSNNASTSYMTISNRCTGCTGIVSTSTSLSAPTTKDAAVSKTVYCVAPKLVSGGGVTDIPAPTGGSPEGVTVISKNYPSAADAWTVELTCTGNSCTSGTATVYARCVNP